MTRLALFASGKGSNYEALMQYLQQHPNLPVEVALVITDQPQAGVLVKAKKWGTAALSINYHNFKGKKQYEQFILTKLKEYAIDFIVLAGYMRIIGSTLLQAYPGRIINLHPSLLPAFPGKDAVGQALAAGVKITGVTVHFIDRGIDTGPIIAQEPIRIEATDNHESLSERIHIVEHLLYPRAVCNCVLGKIYLDDGRVVDKTNQRENS